MGFSKGSEDYFYPEHQTIYLYASISQASFARKAKSASNS